MSNERDTWWLVERRGCFDDPEAQARLLMAPDQFAEWKRDRDERAAFWKAALTQAPADPEGTNAQLLANALSRAEKAEDDLRAEILHSAEMRKERDNARAECAWLAKRLINLRGALNNIARGIDDEGDRAYFGSTNDADWLKDIAQDVDAYAFDRITRESKWPDYIETSRLAHEREAALRERVERLEKALEPFARSAIPDRISGHEVLTVAVHVSDLRRARSELEAGHE